MINKTCLVPAPHLFTVSQAYLLAQVLCPVRHCLVAQRDLTRRDLTHKTLLFSLDPTCRPVRSCEVTRLNKSACYKRRRAQLFPISRPWLQHNHIATASRGQACQGARCPRGGPDQTSTKPVCSHPEVAQ